MSDPIVPNYKKSVGRLVTDRFDFQDHTSGDNFRHNATQVDLFPTVVVDGYAKTTVQSAISALADVIYTPALPDATISSKGVIKLAGDITGTADVITVTKIQGKPVNTLVPLNGQVLTWNGAAWSPATPANVFNAGLDLYGNNIQQRVIQISGDNVGDVTVPASTFTFNSDVAPTFTQQLASTSNGANFSIVAQESNVNASSIGGNILISGGSGQGQSGGVALSLDSLNNYMVQLTQLSNNNRILSLLNESPLDTASMPDNSGDMVIYIKDAVLPPGAGNPSNGVIVYSDGGKLYIRESNGNDFAIGSIPNPSIWGPSSNQTYSQRATAQSNTNVPVSAFVFTMPDNTSLKVDVIMIGKEVHATNNNSVQVSMSAGYTVDNNSNVQAVGAVATYDVRNSGGAAASWTLPDIINVGNTLTVYTGHNAATVINWLAIVQLTIVEG